MPTLVSLSHFFNSLFCNTVTNRGVWFWIDYSPQLSCCHSSSMHFPIPSSLYRHMMTLTHAVAFIHLMKQLMISIVKQCTLEVFDNGCPCPILLKIWVSLFGFSTQNHIWSQSALCGFSPRSLLFFSFSPFHIFILNLMDFSFLLLLLTLIFLFLFLILIFFESEPFRSESIRFLTFILYAKNLHFFHRAFWGVTTTENILKGWKLKFKWAKLCWLNEKGIAPAKNCIVPTAKIMLLCRFHYQRLTRAFLGMTI